MLGVISPLANFAQRFYRTCATTWRSYLLADENMITADLHWAAHRRESQAKQACVSVCFVPAFPRFQIEFVTTAAEEQKAEGRSMFASTGQGQGSLSHMCTVCKV